jgi:FkbM family methyltransferase
MEPGAVVERVNALVPEELGMEAFFDGIWGWKIGGWRIPDPEMPRRTLEDLVRRAGIVEKYERDVADYWLPVYRPQPGDVIADIGAGRGEDVFVFSRVVGSTGLVLALEPHPVSYLALRKLCEWNSLSNVRCLNVACMSEAGPLEIETMPVWESNYVRRGAPGEKSERVEGMRFDEVARREGIDGLAFLKMNIEGAEREALPGCRETLAKTRHVCVAAHDFRADRGEGEEFRTLGLVREFLSGSGFSLRTRDEDRRYYVPYHVHGWRD